jgi:trans-aconitate 2-methyltransferase
MTWSPEVYLTYADERTRPAVELAARVPLPHPARVMDLGCGPGNSTAVLAARWADASIDGLESSPDMLARARASMVRATWIEGDVSAWASAAPVVQYDVVFSNATLHWIPDHRTLVTNLMRAVKPGGALAFQVPRNFDAPSHVLMRETAERGPWASRLAEAGRVHVLEPEAYFDILAPLSSMIDIWETAYQHVLSGDDPVLTWVSGTALRPFVQRLDDGERARFVEEYRQRLREAYPRRANGTTLFPFTRLFVVSTK